MTTLVESILNEFRNKKSDWDDNDLETALIERANVDGWPGVKEVIIEAHDSHQWPDVIWKFIDSLYIRNGGQISIELHRVYEESLKGRVVGMASAKPLECL